jgi:hypothetical protein
MNQFINLFAKLTFTILYTFSHNLALLSRPNLVGITKKEWVDILLPWKQGNCLEDSSCMDNIELTAIQFLIYYKTFIEKNVCVS